MIGGGKQLQIILVVVIGTVLGLTAAMVGRIAYERLVQQPLCFSYAVAKQIPDTPHLTFTGVVIATGQFYGHICNFHHTITGAPVTLEFDKADIPVMRDSLQVLVMVVAFLVGMLPPLKWWPRYSAEEMAQWKSLP